MIIKRGFIVKKIFFLLSISLFLFGCTAFQPSEFTVKVYSSVPYQGQYMVSQIDGKSSSTSISGDGQNIYILKGQTISFSVQKQSTQGEILIEVLKNGNVIKSERTSAPYGIAMITTD